MKEKKCFITLVPVGWEHPREDKPVVDIHLLAAVAQLSPGTGFKGFLPEPDLTDKWIQQI